MSYSLRQLGRVAVSTAVRPGRYVVRRGISAADSAAGAAFALATTLVALLPAAPVGTAMALLTAFVAILPATKAKALSVSTISHVSRPSSSTYGAEQISGITYAGGNLYYAVDDNDNKLYPLTLSINRSTGSLATSGITIGTGVTMSGGNDMEGCAFDPCSGKVWISQETSALIREFDPATGEKLRDAPVPAVQKQYASNYSLEALTISGDGRTMWTANEEALKVDGPLSTNSVGSVVRLTKFTRASVYDNWTPNGEWAYETQPIGTLKDQYTRSGVSGLCALPDDTLLVLERRCYDGGLFPDFNVRLYQVNFSGATEISSISSLKTATYTKTSKSLLWQYTHGSDMPNYEGICLGPRLDKDSCVLVLISDGGSSAEKGVFTLKLSGLNIGTLTVENPVGGTSSIVGGPYRYVVGTTVNIALDGTEYQSAYTNNAAQITNVTWSLSGTGTASGRGPNATFTVPADGTFQWAVSSAPATTPIDNADSFENYPVGAFAFEGAVGAWTGDGEVLAHSYSPADPPGYPMPKDPHTKVLDVDGGVIRAFSNTTNGNDRIDLMIQVTRKNEDSADPELPDGTKVALQCATNGVLELYCRNSAGNVGWVPLDDGRTFEQGEWIRVQMALDSSSAPGEEFVLVRVNGKSFESADGFHAPAAVPVAGGAWFQTAVNAESADGRISAIEVKGTTKLDDVIKTTEAFKVERSVATTDVDGVSLSWLSSHGYGDEPQALANATSNPNLRALGYTAADIFDAGIDPDADEPFAITDIIVDDDGYIELTLNGVRSDLTNAKRNALYPIGFRESLGDVETDVPGTTRIEGGRTIWRSDEPVGLSSGFFKARVNPQR